MLNSGPIRYLLAEGMGGVILLIHGDSRVRRSTREILESAGYRVNESEDLALADGSQPDVILMPWDALAPVDEYVARIRNDPSLRSTRVVIMSRREDLGAAAQLLDAGADDCVGAPFAAEELTARVRACLRRPAAHGRRDSLSAGPVVLDVGVHHVLVHGQRIELAPTEFRLMAFFLENQGRVFSRGELLRRAWAKNIKAGPRTVDVHVRRLRQQLEPFGCEQMIQTVRGFGYRFATNGQSKGRASSEAVSVAAGNR